jgi:hypothetical protein
VSFAVKPTNLQEIMTKLEELKAAMNAAGIELAKAINYNDVAENDYLNFYVAREAYEKGLTE